jgi:hypothetical protein
MVAFTSLDNGELLSGLPPGLNFLTLGNCTVDKHSDNFSSFRYETLNLWAFASKRHAVQAHITLDWKFYYPRKRAPRINPRIKYFKNLFSALYGKTWVDVSEAGTCS